MSKLLSNTTWLLNIDWGKVADFLFVDKEGKFQWIGVSAILAVFAFIFNIIWEHHKLNADIKSKSRIKWMEIVRDYLADYSISVQAMDLSLRRMLLVKWKHKVHPNKKVTDEDGVDVTEVYNELYTAMNDDLNAKSREVSKNISLLQLYIPKSPSNDKLNEEITCIATLIESARDDIMEYRTGDGKINEVDPATYAIRLQELVDSRIKDLMTTARDYMKTEWERAKKGH